MPMSLPTWSDASPTTESWSGRSSRTSPFSEVSPPSSSLPRAYRYLRGTPSHSSSGPEPAAPQTQACASLVTGRVTPTAEKSAPAR